MCYRKDKGNFIVCSWDGNLILVMVVLHLLKNFQGCISNYSAEMLYFLQSFVCLIFYSMVLFFVFSNLAMLHHTYENFMHRVLYYFDTILF